MFDPSEGLDDLERAIDKLTPERPLDLPRLRRLADRLVAHFVHAVGAAERAGRLGTTKTNAASALSDACRMSFAEASRTVEMAHAFEALPVTSLAVLDGEISLDHARVLTKASTRGRADAFRNVEGQLVEVAKAWDVKPFAKRVKRLCDAFDGDNGLSAANKAYDERHVHLSASFERLGVLSGQLDAEGTEYVLTAFDARMEDDPDLPGEPKRTRAQRRADALVDICRLYLDQRDQPHTTRRRGRPQLGGIFDLQAVRRDGHVELADTARCELNHVGAISPETMRRLICDASIHRIIVDGDSQPLDVGRSQRTAPETIWRALVVRDGGCVYPGCDRLPAECQAHHKHDWIDGGETTLDNSELRCRRHHRDVHEGWYGPSP
jgi:hypothetical protein